MEGKVEMCLAMFREHHAYRFREGMKRGGPLCCLGEVVTLTTGVLISCTWLFVYMLDCIPYPP